MTPRKPPAGGALFGAALFGFVALVLFVRARQADVAHNVIHYWLKPGFMTPFQGYALAALLLGLAAYCAMSGSDFGEGRNELRNNTNHLTMR
jgi:hypothetical protein